MVRIGKIAGTHGLQGAVVLTHVLGKSNWLKKDSILFLELLKSSYIPHFIESFKPLNDGEYLLLLEDVNTVETAKKLVGRNVYADQQIMNNTSVDSPLRYIGFNLVDKTIGSVGTIEDVVQVGPQWLAKLTVNDNEVLIPLVEAFIVDVNTRNRFIRMDLPEGLLDL